LLWQFRHTLVSEPKALVKFLYCIDWRYAHDVEHATALLKRWEQIDVDDALLLLSNDFTARNALIRHVRRFAVETLSKTARDEDIVSYLLQLVQALRYEPELSTSLKDNASSSTSKNSTSKNSEDDGASDTTSMTEEKKDEDDNSHEAMKSPLARFLITRAVKSPVCSCCFIIDTDTHTHTQQVLANYLHWYLVAEFSAPTKDDEEVALFMRVHEAFLQSLEGSGQNVCRDILRQTEMLKKLFMVGTEQKRLGGSCDTKTKRMRKKLAVGGEYEDMAEFSSGSVPLPYVILNISPFLPHLLTHPIHRYNPTLRVRGVVPTSPKVFKSAQSPFTLEFRLTTLQKKQREIKRRSSKNLTTATTTTTQNESNELLAYEKHRVMFKLGDDLRQDQLILQMITLMDDLMKRVRLDLRLTPFRVMATGHLEGLVEFVPHATPLRYVGNIRNFLQKHNPSSHPLGISRSAMSNFVKSCAGYAVITYILGIGDRHLDNILLKENGQLFHIDFGYIFGRDPKWNAPLIRLTKYMVEAMGGPQSRHYHTFLTLSGQAYNILRQNATLILNLLNLMVDANIEGVTANDLLVVKDRFMLDRSDEEAERYLHQLLRSSVRGLDALWADILDLGHAMAN